MKYCPKCGKKIAANAKFCPKCGREISKLAFKKYLPYGLGLLAIPLIILLAKPLKTKITSFFAKPPAEEIRQDIGNQEMELNTPYFMLSKLEKKYLDRAYDKALDWSKTAKLCYFYISISNLNDKSPRVEYTFCADDKEKILRYVRTSPRDERLKEDSNKLGYRQEIVPFPADVLVEEAVDLAVKKLEKAKNCKVSDFSASLRGDKDYWNVYLSTKINDKYQRLSCKVYMDKKVDCQE